MVNEKCYILYTSIFMDVICLLDLLEKSRVTFCLSAERNYHVFYQLLTNAIPEYHEMMLVTPDAALYTFINQGALTVDGINDSEEMKGMDVSSVFNILNNTKDYH